MFRTAHRLAVGLILLSIASSSSGQSLADREPLAALESGTATVQLEQSTFLVEYYRTVAGPLFPLQPLASRLGGELTVGPLGQSHTLEVTGAAFVFGPGSPAMTEGENVLDLTQPPATGAQGLMVPLDLLRRIYTQLMGFGFTWKPDERTLEIARQPLRQIPVTFDVVTLQGVTTLVFQFPTTPRYKIERSPARIRVDLIGDKLDVRSPRLFAADKFVRDVRLTPQSIIIDLAPLTKAQDYSLEDPFRLVFDVLRDTGPRLPAATPEISAPRRRGKRIETIVIDPGHGGAETGAIGPSGTLEKDLTLLISRLLQRRLEQRLPVRAVLTRSTDVEVPLDTRSSIANLNKGDLFISIHLNSSPDPRSHGTETFFLSLEPTDEAAAESARIENLAGDGDPLYDLQLMLWDLAQSRYMAASQRIAKLVQAEFNDALGLRNRGVKQAPFRVLVGTAMPALLVELGFLNNPEEESRLLQPTYREQLVEALVRAVSRYVNETADTPAPGGTVAPAEQPAEP